MILTRLKLEAIFDMKAVLPPSTHLGQDDRHVTTSSALQQQSNEFNFSFTSLTPSPSSPAKPPRRRWPPCHRSLFSFYRAGQRDDYIEAPYLKLTQ